MNPDQNKTDQNPDQNKDLPPRAAIDVRHVILVLSGKGGVGKIDRLCKPCICPGNEGKAGRTVRS